MQKGRQNCLIMIIFLNKEEISFGSVGTDVVSNQGEMNDAGYVEPLYY